MTEFTDYSSQLKVLMQRVDVSSYQALANLAGVSLWQVRQLRMGKVNRMRVFNLIKVAGALQISLVDLLSQFGVEDGNSASLEQVEAAQVDALKQEYHRLQRESAQRLEDARSQFQSEALQTLESWLVQWPLIAKRAKEKGAELPAEKLLPFVRPIESLVGEWGVKAIAPVDAQLPYDPQYHQLMGATVPPGELVTVTHSGAMHNGKILHRAKVKS